MKYLNELKKDNERKRMFPLTSESGEAIIEEEEFQALKQLNKVILYLLHIRIILVGGS